MIVRIIPLKGHISFISLRFISIKRMKGNLPKPYVAIVCTLISDLKPVANFHSLYQDYIRQYVTSLGSIRRIYLITSKIEIRDFVNHLADVPSGYILIL